jgi:hypothetical protein
MATRIDGLRKTLAVTNNRSTLRKNAKKYYDSFHPDDEVIRPSETSGLKRSTPPNIPEDGILDK